MQYSIYIYKRARTALLCIIIIAGKLGMSPTLRILSVLRKEIHRLYYLYFVTSQGEKNCGKFKKIILLFIIKIICNIGYLNRIFLIRWGQNYMMKALYISGKCTCRQSSCLKTIYCTYIGKSQILSTPVLVKHLFLAPDVYSYSFKKRKSKRKCKTLCHDQCF